MAWARVASLVDHIQVLYYFDHCDHGGFDDHDHVCCIVFIIPIMTIMVVSTIINDNVLTCDHVCAIQAFHSVDQSLSLFRQLYLSLSQEIVEPPV